MINIEFDSRCGRPLSEALKADIARYVNKTIVTEGIDSDIDVEISYSTVTPEEIRDLNARFRNQDKATDVLSFPLNDFNAEDGEEAIEIEEGMPLALGDIVINLAQAEKQAKEYGNTFEYEVCYLSVHSVLHLLGYDHMVPEDKVEMRNREKEIME